MQPISICYASSHGASFEMMEIPVSSLVLLCRARFEGLCGPLLQCCVEPVSEVLKSAGIPPTAISKVLLC